MISLCHPENFQHPITTVNTGTLADATKLLALQQKVKLSYTTKINIKRYHLKHSCNYFVPTVLTGAHQLLQKNLKQYTSLERILSTNLNFTLVISGFT